MEKKPLQHSTIATITPFLHAMTLNKDQHKDPPIHTLNDDCLMKIFSYLPIAERVRAERVCTRWRRVIYESWRDLKKLDLLPDTWCLPLWYRGRDVDYNMLRKVLARCGRYLTHLDLRYHCEMLDTSDLWIISKYCPRIRCLDLSHIDVLPQTISILSLRCHHLNKLSIALSGYELCENNLSELFAVNKRLKYFAIQNTYNITGECLKYLPLENMEELQIYNSLSIESYWLNMSLIKMTNLRSLTLVWCNGIDDSTLKVIGKMTQLTHLQLWPSGLSTISKEAMRHLANLINLEQLNFNHKSLITDDLIIDISMKCHRLKYLNISDCTNVTNTGVTELINRVSSISFLNLIYTRITDTVLQLADKIKKERRDNILTIECLRYARSKSVFVSTSPFLRIIYPGDQNN